MRRWRRTKGTTSIPMYIPRHIGQYLHESV
jgi:hypothetical protein